ncbi:hypothetical protein ON010_g13270 [Phytophthora cinnamomi]|nr:hypothetical protein ON010_g13270 [Phytophthora cinnamomi]
MILFIVESLENPVRRKPQQSKQQTSDDNTPHPLDRFVAVQWAKPSRSALASAKYLAKSNTTQSYAFYDNNYSDPTQYYIAKTAGRLQSGKTSKTT